MDDARARTKNLRNDIWQRYLGANWWLYLWSDIPGRFFCRYLDVTEVDDILPHDISSSTGMGYMPPEGARAFVSLIAAAGDPQLAQRVANVCRNVLARNAYLTAYLIWLRSPMGHAEASMEDTGRYPEYVQAKSSARDRISRSRGGRGATTSSGPSRAQGSSSQVHSGYDSSGQSTGSCKCSIL
jgi:hypothetical protein